MRGVSVVVLLQPLGIRGCLARGLGELVHLLMVVPVRWSSVELTYWLGRASTQRAAGGVFKLT